MPSDRPMKPERMKPMISLDQEDIKNIGDIEPGDKCSLDLKVTVKSIHKSEDGHSVSFEVDDAEFESREEEDREEKGGKEEKPKSNKKSSGLSLLAGRGY